jgi:hypothetical protein
MFQRKGVDTPPGYRAAALMSSVQKGLFLNREEEGAQLFERDARIGIAAEALHARIGQRIFLSGQFRIIQRDARRMSSCRSAKDRRLAWINSWLTFSHSLPISRELSLELHAYHHHQNCLGAQGPCPRIESYEHEVCPAWASILVRDDTAPSRRVAVAAVH